MHVLVACEFSGRVRDAFTAHGHDAWSCDLLPSETPGNHIQDDVLLHLDDGWDLMIAHPPCTYLSRAGANLWPIRRFQAYEAMTFVRCLFDCGIERIAIENPVGQLNKLWRYPSQTIQPFMFGDPFRKTTNLWLKNLPALFATNVTSGRPSFVDKIGQTKHRWKERSRTFPGIAEAMALQWGDWLEE